MLSFFKLMEAYLTEVDVVRHSMPVYITFDVGVQRICRRSVVILSTL